MVRVMLVAEAWTRVVEVDDADDVIDAEGMTWERDRSAHSDAAPGGADAEQSADLPRYVPSIGA
jgi:hypothetical protein